MVYIGQIRRAPDGTEVVVESIEDWLGPEGKCLVVSRLGQEVRALDLRDIARWPFVSGPRTHEEELTYVAERERDDIKTFWISVVGPTGGSALGAVIVNASSDDVAVEAVQKLLDDRRHAWVELLVIDMTDLSDAPPEFVAWLESAPRNELINEFPPELDVATIAELEERDWSKSHEKGGAR